jgi:hypothetical protein
VEDLLLRMIVPSELDLTLAVEREVDAQTASLHEQWKLRLEQAQYEARRAERRYKAVDPDNRVVARTLEREWESRLRDLEEVRRGLQCAKSERRLQLSEDDRARIRTLARDLPAVWRAPTTTPADRKAMLRLVIEAVAIRPVKVPERLTQIEVQWQSGAVDKLAVPRPASGDWSRTSSEAIERVRELAGLGLIDRAIADKLNAERVASGSGKAWTEGAVKHLRLKHAIFGRGREQRCRRPLPDRHPDGRYSMPGAMKRFGVSQRQLNRWIDRGMVQAVREDFESHRNVWWLIIDAATVARLDERRTTRRRSKDAKLSDRGDAL